MTIYTRKQYEEKKELWFKNNKRDKENAKRWYTQFYPNGYPDWVKDQEDEDNEVKRVPKFREGDIVFHKADGRKMYITKLICYSGCFDLYHVHKSSKKEREYFSGSYECKYSRSLAEDKNISISQHGGWFSSQNIPYGAINNSPSSEYFIEEFKEEELRKKISK